MATPLVNIAHKQLCGIHKVGSSLCVPQEEGKGLVLTKL